MPTPFEVKNGSKMRFRFSSAIPQPVSAIETSTIGTGGAPGSGLLACGRRRLRTVMLPLSAIACSALTSKFITTCLTRSS